MIKRIDKRVVEEAKYMITTNATIRDTAKKFKMSKSTVHKDLQEKLKEIDIELYKSLQPILKKHIELRHINGGEATKRKYLKCVS